MAKIIMEIDSELQPELYVNNLAKMDSLLNGSHQIDNSVYYRGRSTFKYYYGYRDVRKYSEVADKTLLDLIHDCISKLDNAVQEIYAKYPMEIVNAFFGNNLLS